MMLIPQKLIQPMRKRCVRLSFLSLRELVAGLGGLVGCVSLGLRGPRMAALRWSVGQELSGEYDVSI